METGEAGFCISESSREKGNAAERQNDEGQGDAIQDIKGRYGINSIIKKPHLKPKGAAGKAQVARLGRSYKTGGFKKIEAKAAKRYHSTAAGKKVAGAIFNKMAKRYKKA